MLRRLRHLDVLLGCLVRRSTRNLDLGAAVFRRKQRVSLESTRRLNNQRLFFGLLPKLIITLTTLNDGFAR